MTSLRTIISLTAASLLLTACSEDTSSDLNKTLRTIDAWVLDGMYSTAAQVAQEDAENVPEDKRHNLMHQLFVRVDMEGIEGVTYFQQGSYDGTVESTFRAGILQFFIDEELGVIRQRELNFKDVPSFINAYQDPEKIASITPDDVIWDEGCDFHLTLDAKAGEVRGPMLDNACYLPEEQFGQVMVAEDKVVIKPGEFWFLGRYVNEDGVVVWGNESDVLNKMRHIATLADYEKQ